MTPTTEEKPMTVRELLEGALEHLKDIKTLLLRSSAGYPVQFEEELTKILALPGLPADGSETYAGLTVRELKVAADAGLELATIRATLIEDLRRQLRAANDRIDELSGGDPR